MSETRSITTIGWVGLGDQGAPMARAIAEAGYDLHVWARRAASLEALAGVAFTAHETPIELARSASALCFCLREDGDLEEVLMAGGIWKEPVSASVIVNHGTGLPSFAENLARRGIEKGVEVLDAPVSGGHSGAAAKQLTTMVGGTPKAFEVMKPVFQSFSKTVMLMGQAGSGQMGKLINNASLMLNQKSVQDILHLAGSLDLDLRRLSDLLLSGTGASFALRAVNGLITVENSEHLAELQRIDAELFHRAVAERHADDGAIFQRALAGADGLPQVARMLADQAAT